MLLEKIHARNENLQQTESSFLFLRDSTIRLLTHKSAHLVFVESYLKKSIKMQRPGIEPGPPAWQARILPLNQRCLNSNLCQYNIKHTLNKVVEYSVFHSQSPSRKTSHTNQTTLYQSLLLISCVLDR